MDWKILGIDPTTDKKAITAAYRSRLLQTNPEDKPEEFKALRGAYEEAMRLADSAEQSAPRDESPVGLWMEKVSALYADYAQRIRAENWKRLLCDDVCAALDHRPQAEDALLRFLMEHFYVPQEVWCLMDEVFAWQQRREELYDSYPREFIDYAVINGITLMPNLPYDLFSPGKDGAACDEYRRLFHQAGQVPPGELGPILEKLEALPEYHPYGEAMGYRLAFENGDTEKCKQGYRSLVERYPHDISLSMGYAGLLAQDREFEPAKALAEKILADQPDHCGARQLRAECMAGLGDYENAKEIIYELVRESGGDPIQANQLRQLLTRWNEDLIRQGEEKLAREPENGENTVSLAWCYLQNDKLDDAHRVAQLLKEETTEPFEYHNLNAKLSYARGEDEKALSHLRSLITILDGMEPDGTEKTVKRMRRMPEMLQLAGHCLIRMKRRDEGAAYYEKALALAPEDPETLTNMGMLLLNSCKYDRAAEIFRQLTEVLPHGYHGYVLLSMALYFLHRDREAYDAVEHALQIEGGDLTAYTLKMSILMRNGVFDEVRETLQFLRDHGVPESLNLQWFDAQLVELDQKDAAKAMALYRNIAKRMEAGEDMDYGAQLYYHMAILTSNQRDSSKAKHRQEIITLLDKALAIDENETLCLEFKAWLCKQDGDRAQAMEILERAQAIPGHSASVEHGIAELYYGDLENDAAKALECYQNLLAQGEDADLHFFAGTCCRYLGDYQTAEYHYLNEQRLNPEDLDGYNGLAFTYEAMGRPADALEQLDKALAVSKSQEGSFPWLYNHKIQVLRRMEKPEEAIRTADECLVHCGDPHAFKLRFEVCCQFGMWQEAEKTLPLWRKRVGRSNDVAEAAVLLYMYTGQGFKAAAAMLKGGTAMDAETRESLRLKAKSLAGDIRVPLQVWTRQVKEGKDITNALLNLAQALWLAGERDGAAKAAQKVLNRLDEKLKGNLVDEALFRGRRAMALAFVGREQEAREELAKVRCLPLCEYCDYPCCKDADVFEATMEEVCGNTQKAKECYAAGKERWPDELDFVTGLERLRRKEKQK